MAAWPGPCPPSGCAASTIPPSSQNSAKLGHPYVIVTADVSMPIDWGTEIAAAGVTVAVIDSRRSDEFLEFRSGIAMSSTGGPT